MTEQRANRILANLLAIWAKQQGYNIETEFMNEKEINSADVGSNAS